MEVGVETMGVQERNVGHIRGIASCMYIRCLLAYSRTDRVAEQRPTKGLHLGAMSSPVTAGRLLRNRTKSILPALSL